VYFLHTEEVRLGIEHAVSIAEVSEAYPLLDVIDHAKSRAAVCGIQFHFH